MEDVYEELGLRRISQEAIERCFGRMMIKETVSAEELRRVLGDRIPGVFNIAARSMGMTTVDFDIGLKNGLIKASDLVPRLISQLKVDFGT